ncbi:uncharacterized protein PpBr36_05733 [Pyricularia pennisetigena]|uniref:uncharacterized protein n=1 Tax=Pyricularia pennisetigena TaxID=1578925 RepID=UPI00114E7A78|nr:uncharacterized protein PpBr36_05733 [Pyricularia pennisetigena]TLS22615.1 hypothetical protein PpBr36_05733 [Pyricularia pennisetigena]
MPENAQRLGNMMHAVAYPAGRLANLEHQVSQLHLVCQGKPVISELPVYGRGAVVPPTIWGRSTELVSEEEKRCMQAPRKFSRTV